KALRRQAHEARGADRPAPDPLAEITGRELLDVIDEELCRLPEKYRAPVLLCCLEGRSGEEAARALGCSPSTLKRRLARGREGLRARLTRRGLALGAVPLATLLVAGAGAAALPATLAASTARAIALYASEGTAAGG